MNKTVKTAIVVLIALSAACVGAAAQGKPAAKQSQALSKVWLVEAIGVRSCDLLV